MNRIVVITGGSSGIGKATCNRFRQASDKVIELSRSGENREDIFHIDCDITDLTQIENAINQIIDKYGRIDVLVNNAGYGISGPVEDTSIEKAQKQFDVNFFGMCRVTKTALPYIKISRGVIVNLSSVAGMLAIPFQCYYSASKAAINSYTLALANEVKPYGVRVVAVLPGDISTGFTKNREKIDGTGDYIKRVNRSVKTMEKDERNGMSPDFIANKIYKLTKMKSPKPLNTPGFQYKFFMFLYRVLSTKFVNWIISKIYSK